MDSKEDQKPIRDNIMKYILLSILIIPFVSVMILFSLSNPVFGKTPQFYSVGECLMMTMKNKIIALAVVGSLVSCEEQLELEQCCCDWNAANFEIEYNGYNVNQL